MLCSEAAQWQALNADGKQCRLPPARGGARVGPCGGGQNGLAEELQVGLAQAGPQVDSGLGPAARPAFQCMAVRQQSPCHDGVAT